MAKGSVKYSPFSLPAPENIGIDPFLPFFLKERNLAPLSYQCNFLTKNILAVSTGIVYFIPQKAKLNLKTGTSVQNTDCLLDQAREQLDLYPVD